ncbi:MAG: hypothetical protein SPF04_01825 [Bacilli bacterium]|nr:hypothetical protein [Candidatus Onthovivens sp.]MDY5058201.1 hypothetical protein [Bacilli bacterium]
MKSKELSIKELQEDITKVLKGFNDVVNAELDKVIIDNGAESYTRKATHEDTIDFIRNAWANASQELSELGINIEEEPTVEEQTNYIYFELSEVMEEAYINGEYAELEYNGMIIQYDGLRKASDDMLIFYKDIDDESTEVARIILNENANYEINKTSKYSVELVRK